MLFLSLRVFFGKHTLEVWPTRRSAINCQAAQRNTQEARGREATAYVGESVDCSLVFYINFFFF